MDKLSQFYEAINSDQCMILATSQFGRVSMRTVSPVLFKSGILFFTSADSLKYKQLKENPHCCVSIGSFFAEASAEFLGSTMLSCNEEFRHAYNNKFPGAFDENIEFGGRDAEFILLTPTRLSGWAFENDVTTDSGIPTIPFDIEL